MGHAGLARLAKGAVVAGGAVLVVGWSLVPFYWGVVVAISTPASISRIPISVLPRTFTLSNFSALLGGDPGKSGDFLRALANSLVQAAGSTALTLLIALPAAYAFARITFRASGVLLGVITFTLAVPTYLVLIPLFEMAVATRTVNTQIGVILILTSAALPLAIWILRSHIASLPPDLESAAQLDGAGTLRILAQIVGPLVAPGAVAAAVVVFLGSWGAFLIPLVYAGSDTMPLTVLIPTFASKFSSNYGLQAAAGILAALPPILLVVLLQRHLVSGLLKGAAR